MAWSDAVWCHGLHVLCYTVLCAGVAWCGVHGVARRGLMLRGVVSRVTRVVWCACYLTIRL